MFVIGWLQSTITHEGQRSSAATSYLGPRFISRNNLHVLLNTRVTKLFQTSSKLNSKKKIAFRGVEFAQSEDGKSCLFESSIDNTGISLMLLTSLTCLRTPASYNSFQRSHPLRRIRWVPIHTPSLRSGPSLRSHRPQHHPHPQYSQRRAEPH